MQNPNQRQAHPRMQSLKRMNSMRFLKLSDLEPGDLLFAINPTSGHPQHVAMVTARMDTGVVRQVHQVNDGKFVGLHENDVVPEGLLVMRCRKEGLAKRAAAYALRWSDVPAPYSSLRAGIAQAHEDRHGAGEALVSVHRRLFAMTAKFRAIKYAARRDGVLVTVGERESIPGNKGMFCSMFVAVCYQVAGLDHVVAAGAPRQIVSDKRLLNKDLKAYRTQCKADGVDPANLGEYERYVQHIHEFSPYALDTDGARYKGNRQKERQKVYSQTKFTPCLDFWRGGRLDQFNFAECMTEGMLLDAKVIYPAGLLACLRADPVGWEDCGMLTGERVFSENKDEKSARMNDRQGKIDETYFKRK